MSRLPPLPCPFGYTPIEHSLETEKLSQLSCLLDFEALSGEDLHLLGHFGGPFRSTALPHHQAPWDRPSQRLQSA